ncbi:MAG TPA: sulfite exporter TauE/SafE family protein, partial [Gaiellales bacterium]
MTGLELIAAGLVVGLLVGSTGMGAGSLMAPLLISLFSVSAVAAVGTDLLYSAGTKLVGGARHLTLRTVNVELALWMAAGSVPASVLGVIALNRLAASEGAAVQSDMKVVIGIALMLVAVTVAVRTFVTIRGLWDASTLPADGEVSRKQRHLALVIGVVFGFVFGLTSV